ncbi:MAG: hypothetical protein A4E72_01191 [Syntrophus sp. PtaU1.Bin208]|nr:MAG: hypothetical protein A4E72_01191 [Syntrophus sp. PtaU1.Bin208]
MKKKRWNLFTLSAVLIIVSFTLFSGIQIYAAYNHEGDKDSLNFREAYPNRIGSKLDSCTLCHRGGSYMSGKKPVTLGSCQWCHYKTNYGAESSEANLLETLNSYGLAYKNKWSTEGRTAAALLAIAGVDSDNDGYSNEQEINAGTYPGDATDDPSKIPAPSRVLSLPELEKMAQHTQFMLMNASKSDDSYTEYKGIALEALIRAIMLDSATGITVYAPDGFATYHPLDPSANSNTYHVLGIYPQGTFYYDKQADMATNPSTGWCNYSSPSAAGRETGEAISNPDDLKMMLAFKRDGEYLTPGELNLSNKLDGEGPYRIVPPQKTPGPPDQRSTAVNATDGNTWKWPYNENNAINDHNAGFSSRTVTMIKVEPLPPGTTDINTMEAGWPYVDGKKVIIYGAIDPRPLLRTYTNLDILINTIKAKKAAAFRNKSSQLALVKKLEAIKKQVARKAYTGALTALKQDVVEKMDGYLSGGVDANDWVTDLKVQKQLCTDIQKIWIALVILGG